jgi:hypothetical protein
MTNTIVSIKPNNQISSLSDQSIIEVYCQPSEPIKAFELGISFNPAILQAVSVEQGNIFKGYTTFFNPGVINNTTGNITQIYNLTLGAGNMVTNPGSLVKIKFNNISRGQSSLTLNNVGITNETIYIPITTINGIIIIHKVQVTDTKNIVINVRHS